jgi:hypothetical protein
VLGSTDAVPAGKTGGQVAPRRGEEATLSRNLVLRACVAAVFAAGAAFPAQAQANYPARTIALVVPLSTGGATDILARIAAMNVEPLGTTPEGMQDLIRRSAERWVPLIEAAKITVE